MRPLSLIIFLAAFLFSTVASAEVKTFTATHTYVLGDHDSKDDARQRCLIEAKRKILEQAGVYIESASEMKNFDLTKDKISSFAAAVMHITNIKEEVGFERGQMTLTIKLNAQVDLAEMGKQLAARQVDAGVRDDLAAQKQRLQSLEAQLKAMMHRQQRGQFSEPSPSSPPIDISATDLEWWHARAAEGHAIEQAFLGILYENGVSVPQDYAKAAKWYEQAAIQGYVPAQVGLGLLYAEGTGVPQDYGKARQWFEKAAAQGYAEAQYSLGVLYAEGKGVPQDYAQARQWYEKAATKGYAHAQTSLGLLYYLGNGVAKDYATARHWFEQAVNQGDAWGQHDLGMLYLFGQGVPKDDMMARHWFEKAAAQGLAKSQSYLGRLYFSGDGVPQDYRIARQWFEKAAAQEDGGGQAGLGAAYLFGQGGCRRTM